LMGTPDEFVGPVNIGNTNEFTILELAHKVVRSLGQSRDCSKALAKR
jgi:UDP-glucuronate decarboxylase